MEFYESTSERICRPIKVMCRQSTHTEANTKELKKLFYVPTYQLHVSTYTERFLTNSKSLFYVPTYTNFVSTHNVQNLKTLRLVYME